MGETKRVKRRWGENDHHFGPLTFSSDSKWRPLAVVISSGRSGHSEGGCNIRFQAFARTMICELPAIIKPWREWHDLRGKEWANGSDGFWEEHEREYGFSLSDGHLHVKLGAQTMDSSTTQDWSCFLPWTQWRHVRHSYYGLQGEHIADAPDRWHIDGRDGRPTWEQFKAVEESIPTVQFAIKDYDGEQINVTTRIEEREWRFGTGYFKWLSWFRRAKIQRSLDISFSSETGPEKGSWKGGTIGTSIGMLPGELHEAAFRRYCDEEHRSRYRPYRVTFVASIGGSHGR